MYLYYNIGNILLGETANLLQTILKPHKKNQAT